MPLIDGASSAVFYFASNAESTSLKEKMQTLAIQSAHSSASGRETPMRLVERKLRELVCADSKPIASPKSSQISRNDDGMPPFIDQESSHLGVFTEIEAGEEVLLPGEWPLHPVSSFYAEDVVNGLNQEFMSSSVIEGYMAEWIHQQGMSGSPLPYPDARRVMDVMDTPGMAHIQQHTGLPLHFNEYHDRMLLKAQESKDRGEGSYPSPSSQASASRPAHVQQQNSPEYFKQYHDRLLFKSGCSDNTGEGPYLRQAREF